MATPAQIRAQYYKSKRRSPEAQAIAERLENAPRESIAQSSRISSWNRGEDPTLKAMSAAELALAPGGFSSVGMNPAERRRTVQAALDTEAPEWLPSEMRSRLQKRQDEMGQRLVGREKEQAEFSRMAGVKAPAMGGEAPVSAATRREREQAGRWTAADEALEKAGVTAETYWEEDPMKTGSFVREATTPEGNVITQRIGAEGFSSTITPSSEAATMTAQRGKAQEEGEAEGIRASAVKSDIEKKRAAATAERAFAEGQRSADLFAKWEADKRYKKEGEQLQKSARRRLASINRALREDRASLPLTQRGAGGRFTGGLSAEEYTALLDERGALEDMLSRRDTLNEKGLTRLGAQAERARAQRAEEAASIRRGNIARAAAADITARGVTGLQTQAMTLTPYADAILGYSSALAPSLMAGFGGFGVSGSAPAATEKKDKK